MKNDCILLNVIRQLFVKRNANYTDTLSFKDIDPAGRSRVRKAKQELYVYPLLPFYNDVPNIDGIKVGYSYIIR